MHDNSAIHTARVVSEWLEEHPEIDVVRWPAKSPDLNPIENLWGNMVREWNAEDVNIRNRYDLNHYVRERWEFFRQGDICSNLVASMNRRLTEVIENDGYYTKY